MAKERYETGKAPELTFAECAGDIVIRGWAEPAVMIQGQHDVQEAEGALVVSASGSLKAWAPAKARVHVKSVSGDVIIKGIDGAVRGAETMGDLVLKSVGDVQIGVVHGDLAARGLSGVLQLEEVMGDVALRNVGSVQLGTIHGDLALRYVEGAVEVKRVMGDASLQTVSGDVTIYGGERDVNLNNLGGRLSIEDVSGDVRLKGGLPAGKHHCRAQGDIVVRWPEDAPVSFLVSAPQVRNRLQLQDVVEKEGSFSGRIGDGDTQLVLEAGGRVILKEVDVHDWESDFSGEWIGLGTGLTDMGVELAGLGEHISQEINERMTELSTRMEQQFGADFAQKMADKAARRTEKAMRKAMRQAERMRERSDPWTPPPPQPRGRREKGNEPSAEEQVKILSMLEKGIISVEEADNLLKALEE